MCSVLNIRKHLAAEVPLEDQILLLGPPYKVPKDATLGSSDTLAALRQGDEEDGWLAHNTADSSSRRPFFRLSSATEKTGAKRLFLFSKKALSGQPTQLEEQVLLQPQEIVLPLEPEDAYSSFSTTVTTASHPHSPLHQALDVYERRFKLNLCQGRTLADGGALRLESCLTCLGEQAVMAQALRAAVSNLSDHRSNATRAMAGFATDFHSATNAHKRLLSDFESLLETLAKTPLHPTLVAIAKRSGRRMETLLDCIPVDRYRAWANQCQVSHERLQALFGELEQLFTSIGNVQSWQNTLEEDESAEEQIMSLNSRVETEGSRILEQQNKRVESLTQCHGEVANVVIKALSGGVASVTGDAAAGGGAPAASGVQAAFSILEEMSQKTSQILPSMLKDDSDLRSLMQEIAQAKSSAMTRMKTRLRDISVAQSTIQRVLSSILMLRDTLAQQSVNMESLEHIAEFQSCYYSFLGEVQRRRAYNEAVSSCMEAMMERIATLRAEEVKHREKFLRNSGRHLMPPFYEIFCPTLASPPPIFAPQLPGTLEMDSLPDVHLDDDKQVLVAKSKDDDTVKSGDDSKSGIASSGTKDSSDPLDELAEQTEGLIVSAGGQDTDGAGTDDNAFREQRAAFEAERKALLYENLMLRQSLQRYSNKQHAPKSFVAEALQELEQERQQEKAKQQDAVKELSNMEAGLAALRDELELTKSKLNKSQTTLAKAKKRLSALPNPAGSSASDKISHTSFEVGDVGLFMPTGRGKKVYLAFHSNCPHHYLSSDCVTGNPDYILGRIVMQEEFLAQHAPGSESNPYGLPAGTKFWVLTIEILKL